MAASGQAPPAAWDLSQAAAPPARPATWSAACITVVRIMDRLASKAVMSVKDAAGILLIQLQGRQASVAACSVRSHMHKNSCCF